MKNRLINAFVIALILFNAVLPITALADGTPTITSEFPEYAPTEAVNLYGAGWQAQEAVHIFVNDNVGQTWSYATDVVAADDGSFAISFQLPDWFVATYYVTATGASGSTATTTFADGNVTVTGVVKDGSNNPISGATVTCDASSGCNASFSTTTNASGQYFFDGSGLSGHGAKLTFAGNGPATLDITASKTGYTSVAQTITVSNGNNVTVNFTLALSCTAPSVTTNPSNQTVTYGANATFTAAASGTWPSVQWQVSTDGGTNWSNVSGATSTTLTVSAPTVSQSGSKYRAVFTNTCGSATTTAATLTVSKASATVSLSNLSHTYDGTPKAATATTNPFGLSVDITYDGSATAPTDAGDYSVVATINDANYEGTTSGILHIGKAALTATITASDKIYDGTAAASFTCALSGVVSGDVVSCSGGSATFADKNVGMNKVVTATGLGLSGADAGNYSVNSSATDTADITPKHITGSFTADNKVYDGNTSASVLTRSLSGVILGDDVSLTGGTATFSDKNVGMGKTVTLTGASLTGAEAGNYVLDSVATTTANIAAKSLTISGAVAQDKIYDGSVMATVDFSAATLVGAASGDDVSIDSASSSAQFSDKNVGNGKTVMVVGVALSGTDAGNYTVSQPSGLTADITAKHITGSFTADNKVYDGNTSATVLTRSLSGVVSGDSVSLTGGTATFADKNVGNGKIVTLAGASLSGTDASNYVLDSVATITANITPKHITGSFTADNKVYDGNTSASVLSRSLSGAVSGDDVSLTGGTATIADKNVGSGKTVTLAGASLSGADAGNYILDSVATTTADITPKHITGSFTADNKVYDGNVSATVLTRSLNGAISGDAVSLTGGTATFADKNVGTGKIVTLSGASLSGLDASNYILDSVATTTANITAKHITGSFTADNKVYDGNTSASVLSRSLTGAVSGDDVSLTGGTATFSDKNVGMGKIVTLLGANLTGVDAGNYVLDSVATTTANITARPIEVTADAKTKILNAADPTLNYQVTSGSLVSGDSFSGALTRVPGEAVGQYDILQGTLTAGSNYNLTYVGAKLTITYAPAGGFCYAGPGGVILQPINSDGSSVFKKGSTVPAKFRVCDAYGNSIGTPGVVTSFKLVKVVSGTAESYPNEDPISTTPDTAFRWSSTDMQWIFNINTKNLTAGKTYYYGITLNDGSHILFQFGLK